MAIVVPTQAVVETGTIREITLAETVSLAGSLLNAERTLAQADDVASVANLYYIALETGSSGTAIQVATIGARIDFGAVLTQGFPYFLSATAGAFGPYADLVSTNLVSFLGIAETTSILLFQPLSSGVAIP